tara:strand:+ start:2844 stop:3059 length:216 start_codon:yes stop_codon:yes gene_type:complete
MTTADRIALINDTTTIESLSNATERAERDAHLGHEPIYDNYSLGNTHLTVSDWQQHWDESDRMFDAMWSGT